MPRIKKQKEELVINYGNVKNSIDKLLQGMEDYEYIVLNYKYLYDYINVLSTISGEFTMRYNPSEETKNYVEMCVFNEIIAVAKIPILHTNIVTEKNIKFDYIIPVTKFHDNLFAFIFKDKSISFRYSYKTKIKIISTNNEKYHSLSSRKKNEEIEKENDSNNVNVYNSDINSDEESDDDYKLSSSDEETVSDNDSETVSKNTMNFNCKLEEEINISKIENYTNIENEFIKNVLVYMSIQYEQLKDIFKKFGNTRIRITLLGNKMTLTSMVPKFNKCTIVELGVININKNIVDEEISFYINTRYISKLKSLSSNFNIIPGEDKKMFKTIEFKVVSSRNNNNEDEKPLYGITLFPGNFPSDKDVIVNGFDVYNSLLIFIPQNK